LVDLAERRRVVSEEGYVCALEAFGSLGGLVLDFLAFFETTVPVTGDSAEVNEHVSAAAVLGDQTETLCHVRSAST
jgi:hypothetical protein